jgi:hypothetical protein
MPSLTIAAAARLCHVDRRTLQRAIHAGRLHLDAQHCLSTDELLLAGYLIAEPPLATPQVAPQVTPLVTPLATPLMPLLERLTLAIESLVIEARQLRQDLRQTPLATPLATPQVVPLVVPLAAPQETPQAAPQLPSSRGAMRRRILALLQDHPEGLSPAQIRDQLGIDRDLNNTCFAMARDGLLRRVGRGRYMGA